MDRKESVTRLLRGELTSEERRKLLASAESAPLTDDELDAWHGAVRLLDEGEFPAETIIAYLQGDAHPTDQEAIESLMEDDPVFRDRVASMRCAYESARQVEPAGKSEPVTVVTSVSDSETYKPPSWLKLTTWMAPTLGIAAAAYFFVIAPRTQTSEPVIARTDSPQSASNMPSSADVAPNWNDIRAPKPSPSPMPTPSAPGPNLPIGGQAPRIALPSQRRTSSPRNSQPIEPPTVSPSPNLIRPTPEPERSYFAQLAESGVPQEPFVRPREDSPTQYAGGGFMRVLPYGLHIPGRSVVLGWPTRKGVKDYVVTLEVNGVPVKVLDATGEPHDEVNTGSRPGWKVLTEQPLVPGVAYEWRVREILTGGEMTDGFGGWFLLLNETQEQMLHERVAAAQNDVERALAYYAFGVYDKADYYMMLALQTNRDPDLRRLAALMRR